MAEEDPPNLHKMISNEMEPEPGANPDRHLVMRCFSLFVCFAAACTAFGGFAFVTFTNDVSTFFHLTQEESDWVISINWLGLICAFPVALMVEKCGIRSGAGVALVLPVLASILMWSATSNPGLYREREALALFYFFLAGAGGGVTYLVAVLACIDLFSTKHRGAAVGVVTSGSSMGPLIYMVMYDTVFVADPADPEAVREAMSGYFIFLSILFAIVNIMGLTFYGCYTAPEQCEPEELQLIRHDTPHTDYNTGVSSGPTAEPTERRVKDLDRNTPISFCELLGTQNFQFLFWAGAISVGLVNMNFNNLEVFLRSANIDDAHNTLPYVSAILGVAGKVIIGVISDRVIFQFPRAGFIMITSAVTIWVYLLCMGYINTMFMLVLHCLFVTACAVVTFALMPTIFAEEFGLKSFPRIWGLYAMACGLTGFLFNNILGVFYGLYTVEGSVYCFGSECFRWTFLIAAACTTLVVTFLVLFIRQGNTPYRHTQTLSK